MDTKRIATLALASLLWLGWFYTLSSTIATPPVTALRWIPPRSTAFMDRERGGAVSWDWVPYDRISQNLKRAVVEAEDGEFFEHQGVDVDAARRAALHNWRKRKFSRGASTITMQLARNLYLSPAKSPWRKVREVLIALKLERELSKDRILEIYLNVAEWGRGIYGAEAAARHYFRKNAKDLGARESAFLAAILPRPRFYDKHRSGPYLNRRISKIEGML